MLFMRIYNTALMIFLLISIFKNGVVGDLTRKEVFCGLSFPISIFTACTCGVTDRVPSSSSIGLVIVVILFMNIVACHFYMLPFYVNLFLFMGIERLNTRFQELVAVGEKNSNAKASRKVSKKQRENVLNISMPRSKGKLGKQGYPKLDVQTNRVRRLKAQKAEPLVKEEGEMSDTEEVYEQFKEVKWMEWCEDVMVEEEKTLKRLQRLQSTSADLPKEKVLLSFWISHLSRLFYFLIFFI